MAEVDHETVQWDLALARMQSELEAEQIDKASKPKGRH